MSTVTQQTICLVIIMTIVFTCLATRLDVEISPTTVNELVTEQANITCAVSGSPSVLQRVIQIAINKDGGYSVASLSNSSLGYGNGTKDNMKAKGILNEINATESYLTLTIENPTEDDGGFYICEISYLDVNDSRKQESVEANMMVHRSDDRDITIHLLNKVSALEKIAESLDEELKQNDKIKELKEQILHPEYQTKELDKKIKRLKEQSMQQGYRTKQKNVHIKRLKHKRMLLGNQIKQQEDEITKLREQALQQENKVKLLKEQIGEDQKQNKRKGDKIKELKEQIKELEAKESFSSAFMSFPNDRKIEVNRTVYFYDKEDIGNNLDPWGFKAPRRGLYFFSITMASRQWLHVDLMHNKLIVASLHTEQTESTSMTSASVVLLLQVGDRVRPVTRAIGLFDEIRDKYSSFCGYLIKLL